MAEDNLTIIKDALATLNNMDTSGWTNEQERKRNIAVEDLNALQRLLEDQAEHAE